LVVPIFLFTFAPIKNEIMKEEIQKYIKELKALNEERTKRMNEGVSEYAHTVLVHTYNQTIDHIKRLESIIK